MKEVHLEAVAANTLAKETMKRFYDRTKGESINYQIGSQVWLEGKNITPLRPTKKFADKRYGPFKVLEKSVDLHTNSNFLLLGDRFTLSSTKYYSPIHRTHIQRTKRNHLHLQKSKVEGHPEYEVEEILNVQKRGRGLRILGTLERIHT